MRHTVLAAGLSMVLFVGTAHAEIAVTVGPRHRLRYDLSDGATARWVETPEATQTLDDSRAIRFRLGRGDRAKVFTKASLHLTELTHFNSSLSFDYSGTLRNSFPRITVAFEDGSFAYLAASRCISSITGEPTGIARFSDDLAEEEDNTICTIVASNGTTYTDTGSGAWQAFIEANPDRVVRSTYLEVRRPGTYFVDCLDLGTKYNYGVSNRRAYGPNHCF